MLTKEMEFFCDHSIKKYPEKTEKINMIKEYLETQKEPIPYPWTYKEWEKNKIIYTNGVIEIILKQIGNEFTVDMDAGIINDILVPFRWKSKKFNNIFEALTTVHSFQSYVDMYFNPEMERLL